MQFTLAAVVACLAASVSAVPSSIAAKRTAPSVTLSLINDQSGRNANAAIVADGGANHISQLFHGSAVDDMTANHDILATSAQLIAFPQGIECTLDLGATAFYFDDQATFVRLVQNINDPLNLSSAVFSCFV